MNGTAAVGQKKPGSVHDVSFRNIITSEWFLLIISSVLLLTLGTTFLCYLWNNDK